MLLFIQEEHVIAELEGHQSRVNCAEFSPYYTSTLVTAGDDRTFKVSISLRSTKINSWERS